MAQDQTTRIKELRKSFQDTDRKRAELNGRRDQLMERLEKEFNVKDLAEAEKLAEELAEGLKDKNAELDEAIKKLEAMKA
jgi:predicted transcriptional regulator